jgi:spore coat polysaccharide biosynthesis protein SpsF (cytidylyltransferase family)
MRVVCIIQARLGSTRLPGKALLDLHGRPMIRHVVDRALEIDGVHQVVVAVPNRQDAKAIADTLVPLEVPVVWYPRIAENDVLARYALAATEFKADAVVRITGDCPLLNPALSSVVVQEFKAGLRGYVSNVVDGYEDGTDTEVFCADALRDAHEAATDPSDREHVTPMLRRWCQFPAMVRAGSKSSVDTHADYERVKALMVAHV